MTKLPNSYRVIDEQSWPRAMHCQVFRHSAQPQYCVGFDLDISHFLKRTKALEYSFTAAFVYAVCRTASGIEAFRYRFVDGKIVLFNQIDTSFTYINDDSELFKVINVPMQDTLAEYVALAEKQAREQQPYFTGPMGNDIFQCSPFPWVSFTHISHTDSGKKDNATPLFDWGKYYMRDGKTLLPFSVQAHHSFVDGIHIGRLADTLQAYLNEI